MAWALKPKFPTGTTFDGEMVWTSTDIEIPLEDFKNYVENIRHKINSQFENKYTGFETNKYKVQNSDEKLFRIMLVGNLPRWLQDALHRLAIAMNGAGIILQWKDDFFTGTTSSPVTYEARWLNAGDFVDNNELLCGGSMELLAYDSDNVVTYTEFQKVIATPASGLEWTLHIDDASGTDHVYYRVI